VTLPIVWTNITSGTKNRSSNYHIHTDSTLPRVNLAGIFILDFNQKRQL